jgi:hypothetical protein
MISTVPQPGTERSPRMIPQLVTVDEIKMGHQTLRIKMADLEEFLDKNYMNA